MIVIRNDIRNDISDDVSDDISDAFREARIRLLRYVRDIVTPHTSSYSVMRIAPIPPRDLYSIRPYIQARAFRHFPTKFGSYTNGKSFARLDAVGLRAHGPHHFRSVDGAGGKSSIVTHQIPAHVAVVLHYESATFERCASLLLL